MRTPAYSAVWRSQTENPALYRISWRDLTYAEHQRFRLRSDHPRLVFCEIYETCLIEGPALDQAPAGIVCWIARQQLEENPFSGKFRQLNNALLKARAKVESSWFQAARAVVASTFRYTFEEIDSWPPDLFFERVAQAELLTGCPLEPSDPNAPARDQGKGKGKARPQPKRRAPPEIETEHTNWTRPR